MCRAYQVLGFDAATGGDEVFRDLVLARIIEPTSKLDSLRVLAETGVEPVDYRTVTRRLPVIAKPAVRQALSAACAARAGLGPASLVLYDVSTLYFETDTGDGFREPGFSKERRLEPQITIGLLTDATGFPLAVEAFEGNKAETATMLPVINAFKAAHQLTDVTVVADAGHDLRGQPDRAAGRRVVVHPGRQDPVPARRGARMARQASRRGRSPTGRCLPSRGRPPAARRPAGSPIASSTTSTATTGPGAPCAASTSRSPRPRRAVDGQAPVKRNRFIKLTGATKSVNRELEAKTRGLAGLEGLHHQPHRADRRSSSSTPTTSCGASRRASACPSTTCRPARSTTTPANRSKRT